MIFSNSNPSSGKIIFDIVERIKGRTNQAVLNPFHVGDVVKIIPKDKPELRDKANLTAIVTEVHEFSCTIKTYLGYLTLPIDNLKLLDYSTKDCHQISLLRERLAKIYSESLEPTVLEMLEVFAKLDRAYLTPLEEKMLQVLESQNQ